MKYGHAKKLTVHRRAMHETIVFRDCWFAVGHSTLNVRTSAEDGDSEFIAPLDTILHSTATY